MYRKFLFFWARRESNLRPTAIFRKSSWAGKVQKDSFFLSSSGIEPTTPVLYRLYCPEVIIFQTKQLYCTAVFFWARRESIPRPSIRNSNLTIGSSRTSPPRADFICKSSEYSFSVRKKKWSNRAKVFSPNIGRSDAPSRSKKYVKLRNSRNVFGGGGWSARSYISD